MLSVYLAGPWVRKTDVIKAANEFVAAGITVTSRWFYHHGNPNDAVGTETPIEEIRQQALDDIEDIHRADALVVLNLEKSEGKAVETGIAIAAGKLVVYVGPRSNIFQALGTHAYSVADAINIVHELLAVPA